MTPAKNAAKRRLALAGDARISKRAAAATEFYENVIDAEERPLFVSDQANVFDFSMLEEDELVQRIARHYGVTVAASQLDMPFWKLLDQINDLRRRRPN